jgi:hypothetical protein
MGIAEVVTAPGSSWQNAYVERVSARSAESVWTTSSSSTSAICVASFHRTWITTTALGHISPWTRIARNSGRYRRARSGISSPSLKSAGCIIDTSASRRDFFALTNDCRCSDRCGAVQTSLDRSKLASSYPGGSREFRSQPNDIAARTSSSPDSDGNFRRDRSKSFKESSRSFRPQVRSQGRTKCQCRSSSVRCRRCCISDATAPARRPLRPALRMALLQPCTRFGPRSQSAPDAVCSQAAGTAAPSTRRRCGPSPRRSGYCIEVADIAAKLQPCAHSTCRFRSKRYVCAEPECEPPQAPHCPCQDFPPAAPWSPQAGALPPRPFAWAQFYAHSASTSYAPLQ